MEGGRRKNSFILSYILHFEFYISMDSGFLDAQESPPTFLQVILLPIPELQAVMSPSFLYIFSWNRKAGRSMWLALRGAKENTFMLCPQF